MNATEPKTNSESKRPSRRRGSLKDVAKSKLPRFSWAKLSPARLVRKFIQNPMRGIRATIEGLIEGNRAFWRGLWTWLSFQWKNRRLHHLVYGLPALICLTLVIYGSFSASREFQRDLIPKYQAQAHESFAAKDFKSADLYCRRLVHIGNEPEFRYMLAVAADELGQKERAAALISALAPLDGQGYYEAHGYQAMKICLDKKLQGNPQAMDVAIVHFERALAETKVLDGRAIMWHDNLGKLYMGRGRPDLAIKHLEQSAILYPDRRLLIATIHQRNNEIDKAKVAAEHARGIYELKVKQNPADDESRIHLAEANMLLKQSRAAVTTLEEGVLIRNDSIALHQALSAALVYMSRELLEKREIDMGVFLRIISDAIKHDPKNQQALQTLVNLCAQKGKMGEEVRQLVGNMLAQGIAPSQCHLILGNYAHQIGNIDKARFHFEQALRLSPDAPDLANNFAWALAKGNNPDLPRALTLINSALDKSPNVASFLDTRGQILLKMGKPKEALSDLQKALEVMNRNPGTHRALAECYEKLGDPEMAGRHAALAKEMDQSSREFADAVERAAENIPKSADEIQKAKDAVSPPKSDNAPVPNAPKTSKNTTP